MGLSPDEAEALRQICLAFIVAAIVVAMIFEQWWGDDDPDNWP